MCRRSNANARVARPGWDVWGNEAPEGDPCAMPADLAAALPTTSHAADVTIAKSEPAGPPPLSMTNSGGDGFSDEFDCCADRRPDFRCEPC